MKKQLLATTALVGAVLIAGTATAESAIGMSGSMDFQFRLSQQTNVCVSTHEFNKNQAIDCPQNVNRAGDLVAASPTTIGTATQFVNPHPTINAEGAPVLDGLTGEQIVSNNFQAWLVNNPEDTDNAVRTANRAIVTTFNDAQDAYDEDVTELAAALAAETPDAATITAARTALETTAEDLAEARADITAFYESLNQVDLDGSVLGFDWAVHDPEFAFTATNETATGLTYGMELSFDIRNNAPQIKNAFGHISGDNWGQIKFGAVGSAADSLASYGYAGGGSGNVDGDAPTFQGNVFGGTSAAKAAFSSDVPADMGQIRVAYYSPNIYGLQLGVSYGFHANSVEAESWNLDGRPLVNAITVGASYSNTFPQASDLTLKLGLGFATAIVGKSPDNLDGDIPLGIKFGASIDVVGVEVALGVTYSGAAKTKPINFAAGVGYDFGPGKVGAGFAMALITADLDATPADETSSLFWKIGLGADYAVASGIKVYGDFAYASDTNGLEGAALVETSSFGLVLGTKLSF